jgi:hypothetical protein
MGKQMSSYAGKIGIQYLLASSRTFDIPSWIAQAAHLGVKDGWSKAFSLSGC